VNNDISIHPTLIGLILLTVGLVISVGGTLYKNKQPNLFLLTGIVLGLVIFVSLAIFYYLAIGVVIGLTGLIILLVLTGKLSGKLLADMK
jgi:CHASE2 domain-containing sensor protein